jgi:hypothetical protein
MESDDGGLIAKLLEPDEVLVVRARAGDALIAITDRRLAVLEAERIALAVDILSVRRVQFDIEKSRPATLVIVPERPGDPPQVLVVPAEDYQPIASALVEIGRRLAEA